MPVINTAACPTSTTTTGVINGTSTVAPAAPQIPSATRQAQSQEQSSRPTRQPIMVTSSRSRPRPSTSSTILNICPALSTTSTRSHPQEQARVTSSLSPHRSSTRNSSTSPTTPAPCSSLEKSSSKRKIGTGKRNYLSTGTTNVLNSRCKKHAMHLCTIYLV